MDPYRRQFKPVRRAAAEKLQRSRDRRDLLSSSQELEESLSSHNPSEYLNPNMTLEHSPPNHGNNALPVPGTSTGNNTNNIPPPHTENTINEPNTENVTNEENNTNDEIIPPAATGNGDNRGTNENIFDDQYNVNHRVEENEEEDGSDDDIQADDERTQVEERQREELEQREQIQRLQNLRNGIPPQGSISSTSLSQPQLTQSNGNGNGLNLQNQGFQWTRINTNAQDSRNQGAQWIRTNIRPAQIPRNPNPIQMNNAGQYPAYPRHIYQQPHLGTTNIRPVYVTTAPQQEPVTMQQMVQLFAQTLQSNVGNRQVLGRPIPMKMPKYDPTKKSATTYLDDLETYFQANHYNPEEYHKIVPTVLSGDPKLWHENVKHEINNWNTFRARFIAKYDSDMEVQRRQTLLHQKRQSASEPLETFIWDYLALSRQVYPHEPEETAVRRCRNALFPKIRTHLPALHEWTANNLIQQATIVLNDLRAEDRYNHTASILPPINTIPDPTPGTSRGGSHEFRSSFRGQRGSHNGNGQRRNRDNGPSSRQGQAFHSRTFHNSNHNPRGSSRGDHRRDSRRDESPRRRTDNQDVRYQNNDQNNHVNSSDHRGNSYQGNSRDNNSHRNVNRNRSRSRDGNRGESRNGQRNNSQQGSNNSTTSSQRSTNLEPKQRGSPSGNAMQASTRGRGNTHGQPVAPENQDDYDSSDYELEEEDDAQMPLNQ